MDALPPASGVSAAQDLARVSQLRLARDLMFRAERKAKRVAKIKSRTFRKIAKRSKMRQLENDPEGSNGLTTDEMTQLDALDGGNRLQAERERLETLRARERATLRHASGASSATAGGRWSKGLRGLDGMDDNMKDAIRQRQTKQELLRQKILGRDEMDAGESDHLDPEAATDDEQDDSADGIKLQAFDELAQIQSEEQEKQPEPKGLMGMKFMQRAARKENDRIDGLIEDFRLRVEDELPDGPLDGAEKDSSTGRTGGDFVQNNPGRMVFGPSKNAGGSANHDEIRKGRLRGSKNHKGTGNISRTNGNVSVFATPLATSPSTCSTDTLVGTSSSAKITDQRDAEVNPWLAISSNENPLHISRKNNEQSVQKHSKLDDRAAARLKKEQRKSKEELKKIQADANIDIDLDDVINTKSKSKFGEPAPQSASSAKSPAEIKNREDREMAPPPSSSAVVRNIDTSTQEAGDSEASDGDQDALPEPVRRKPGPQAFKQRDLVARAFAGDNVIADFEAMKQQEIEADAPREEDLTLPGWGTWGGKGVRKQKNPKKLIRLIPGIDGSQRKDAKLKNVILTEKKDKKVVKYLTKDLPFPYTSKAQYELRLAQPTGVEWTTRGTHKEMTMPRVLVKPGVVIKPVIKAL